MQPDLARKSMRWTFLAVLHLVVTLAPACQLTSADQVQRSTNGAHGNGGALGRDLGIPDEAVDQTAQIAQTAQDGPNADQARDDVGDAAKADQGPARETAKPDSGAYDAPVERTSAIDDSPSDALPGSSAALDADREAPVLDAAVADDAPEPLDLGATDDGSEAPSVAVDQALPDADVEVEAACQDVTGQGDCPESAESP